MSMKVTIGAAFIAAAAFLTPASAAPVAGPGAVAAQKQAQEGLVQQAHWRHRHRWHRHRHYWGWYPRYRYYYPDYWWYRRHHRHHHHHHHHHW